MKTCTKSLFGGALLSAGLLTGVAQAQQFQVGYTAAHAYTYAYPNFNSDGQYGNGPFVLNPVSFGSYGDYASATMDFGPGGLSASVFVASAYVYAFAHSHNFEGYFTVDQPFNSTLNWDFSQANNYINNYLLIQDLTNGVSLFFDQGFSSGSAQIAFSPNTDYVVRGLLDVGLSDGKAGTSWSMTVPTPGSAGLLGLAGLVAMRRRR